MPQCVELKPDWAKGYSRLGAAHHGLGEFAEAIKAYEQGTSSCSVSARIPFPSLFGA